MPNSPSTIINTTSTSSSSENPSIQTKSIYSIDNLLALKFPEQSVLASSSPTPSSSSNQNLDDSLDSNVLSPSAVNSDGEIRPGNIGSNEWIKNILQAQQRLLSNAFQGW
uniref:Uncharacterized protein n=1 Tax=Panagrolaimus sp. PS1159 TaxID=55785 RepID=A0AC35F1W8_9BILA